MFHSKFIVAVVNIHRTDAMLLLQGQGFQMRGVTGIPSVCMAIFLSGYFEKWAHHILIAFTFPVLEVGRKSPGVRPNHELHLPTDATKAATTAYEIS
jgi:hypothetical protein